MQPILSICIPTYNRHKFLKETVDCLIPQLSDKIELIIFNNASTDETKQFVETLSPIVGIKSQISNIGADLNMIDCLSGGNGKYVWLLCDDDLPYSNAAERIVEAIEKYNNPPFLFLKTTVSDSQMSNYDKAPYQGDWIACNRDEFLEEVGAWCTFASSIIARRDCFDLEFIKSRMGTYLVPAAITLSTVGKNNKAYVSENPLIFVRSENSGGYDALTVFTKQFSILLDICKKFRYKKSSLRYAYKNSLSMVVPSIIFSRWGVKPTGILNLFRYSYTYKTFYGILFREFRRFFINKIKK